MAKALKILLKQVENAPNTLRFVAEGASGGAKGLEPLCLNG
ncbi:hypothetical protein [Abyssibius alkaniclasticus]